MKKLTLFATALAAVFAASSCSSDDSLAELTPTPEVQGIPLTISVLNDNTRGEDITAINSYNMTAVYNTNAAWFKNIAFTKTNNVWGSDPAQTWSTSDAVTSAQFYAVSTNGNDAPEIGDDLTFSWTSPTTIADQKDLMIGRSVVVDGETKTPSAIDKGETVKLDFTHGLCKVILKPYALCYQREGATSWVNKEDGMFGKIKSIKLCNIDATGDYGFATGEWTPSNNLQNYLIEFDPAIDIQSATDGESFAAITPATHANIYIIPQTVTSWDNHVNRGTNKKALTAESEANHSYIEIEMVMGVRQSHNSLTYEAEYDASDYDFSDLDEDLADQMGWTADDELSDAEKSKRMAYNDYFEDGELNYDNFLDDYNSQFLVPNSANGLYNWESNLDAVVTEKGYEKVYVPMQSSKYVQSDNSFTFTPVNFKSGKTLTLSIQLQNAMKADGTSCLGNSISVVAN